MKVEEINKELEAIRKREKELKELLNNAENKYEVGDVVKLLNGIGYDDEVFVVTKSNRNMVWCVSVNGDILIKDITRPSIYNLEVINHYKSWIDALSDEDFLSSRLTDYLRNKLNWFLLTVDIDVTQLESYHHDTNPYDVEEQLAHGSEEDSWDEDEAYKVKVQKTIDDIKSEGVLAMLGFGVEKHKELDRQCINFLEEKL